MLICEVTPPLWSKLLADVSPQWAQSTVPRLVRFCVPEGVASDPANDPVVPPDVTVNVTVVEWLSVPLVPVMVTVELPTGVLPLVVTVIVDDPDPLTVGEMIIAMRHGLGRRGGLFPVPSPVLKTALQALGHAETYRLFVGSLVADSSALAQVNWTPGTSTQAGLAALMRASKERNVA